MPIHPDCIEKTAHPKATVFCLGILTSSGSPTGQPRGAAAAVLLFKGAVWGATVICLGESITKFNSQLAAFQLALALTSLFLRNENYRGEILILNNIKATVLKITDTKPGLDQPLILDAAWSIDHILLKSTNCSLRFVWVKRVDTQVAYKQAKKLALNTIKDPFDPNCKLYTINYQHAQAKSEATCQWEEHWHMDP